MKGDGEPTGFSLLPTPPLLFCSGAGDRPQALLYRQALLMTSRYSQSHFHFALAGGWPTLPFSQGVGNAGLSHSHLFFQTELQLPKKFLLIPRYDG